MAADAGANQVRVVGLRDARPDRGRLMAVLADVRGRHMRRGDLGRRAATGDMALDATRDDPSVIECGTEEGRVRRVARAALRSRGRVAGERCHADDLHAVVNQIVMAGVASGQLGRLRVVHLGANEGREVGAVAGFTNCTRNDVCGAFWQP